MPRSILVVDANPGLAGMLQQAFTGAGFTCASALTAEEAVRIASSTPIDLAIVDFHVPDASPDDLIRALRALLPQAILLGIPLDNNPDNPILDELGMQGGLYKPFYLPKLVQYIGEILGEQITPVPELPEEEPAPQGLEISVSQRSSQLIPWLEDTDRVTEVLQKVAEENAVVACMVTRGQDLRAWTGALSREQLSLVARKVAETWANFQGGTLTRYIRLPLTEQECFLFSASITVDLDLTLLFDPKTPVSMTRKRAQAFLAALGKEPSAEKGPIVTGPLPSLPAVPPRRVAQQASMQIAQPTIGQRAQRLAEIFSEPSAAEEFPPSRRSNEPAPAGLPAFQPALSSDFNIEGIDEGAQAPTISLEREEILAKRLKRNVFRIENPPPPDPGIAALKTTPLKHVTEDAGTAKIREALPLRQPEVRESAVARENLQSAKIGALPVDTGISLQNELPAGFETPIPALVKLAYTIVLTPTFPGSRLTPEMSADLEAYIRNIAVSFGWKALRALAQPGHVVVTVSAPPHIAPSFIIRVLRRNCSQRLLSRFPALADNNPAPDFWAPGYLLIGTDEPPSPQQISDYIQFTRRTQGIGVPQQDPYDQ